MKTSSHNVRTLQRGFTLIELLITVAIIILVLAITFPFIGTLSALASGGGGVNTIHAAVAAARGYAGRSIPQNPSVPDVGGLNANYSGVAILFTPGNELRLVENDQQARANGTGDYLETQVPAPSPSSPLNGYRDIPGRDYIHLPKDAGVLGIAREGIGAPTYHTPPFAVRFNQHGTLIAGENDERLVFYDGNANGNYQVTGAGRNRANPFGGGTYNVDEWDPFSQQYSPSNDTSDNPGYNPTENKYKLPFEATEAVIGVIVYSKRDFFGDGGAWPGTVPTAGCGGQRDQPCADIKEWMDTNGNAIFFSRYTGVVMRENQ
jgi:prepilin-type N-terminal cleavage/methylation domain-containing protein